jgi:tRNA U34 5-methylaminomethyl-2-thiouridine-forming methyltransferase MnmC
MGATVLADIRQGFLEDTRHFSTNTRSQENFRAVRCKTGGNALLVSKPIHRTRHAVYEAGGLNFQRSYSLHLLSNIRNLVVQKDLQSTQFREETGGVPGGRLGSPQEINLHFQPDERLNNPIVKMLSETSPLHSLGL